MPIPDGKQIGYECENGHINPAHSSTLDGDARDGKRPACSDCGGHLTRTLIPLLECQDCENIWPYTGDADRPTCPACAGKRTSRVGE
jgi:ribosomal protein L37AE/L43A